MHLLLPPVVVFLPPSDGAFVGKFGATAMFTVLLGGVGKARHSPDEPSRPMGLVAG
jgi:hypothetical protein